MRENGDYKYADLRWTARLCALAGAPPSGVSSNIMSSSSYAPRSLNPSSPRRGAGGTPSSERNTGSSDEPNHEPVRLQPAARGL